MPGVYLIQNNDELVEMSEQEYDSESLLQEILAKYPNLLAGDQIDADNPRRWILIKREMPLMSEEGGLERWSVDHLFLDQDGIPTLVEVKRSSDTRIRREVVGQMLDYAANAVMYWPVETIRAHFEARSDDPELDLSELLGPEADFEQFWGNVKTNLQLGRIRLILIADAISPELRRIVEFLNAQLDPAQVLACEIKQFVGLNSRALVPRIIGNTAQIQQKKSIGAEKKIWDETTFFEDLQQRHGEANAQVARKILDCAINKIKTEV